MVKGDAPTFTILAATPAYLQQTGYTKEAMIGKGVFEAFPVNSDPTYTGGSELLASYNHVLQFQEPHYLPVQRFDLQNDAGGFTEKYWRVSNHPVFSSTGEVAFIIHTSQDITDEVKAGQKDKEHQELVTAYQKIEASQAALRESEAKHRSLFNSMDQGFCVLEMLFDANDRPVDYRFLEANPVFDQQTGLKNVVGKTARQLVPSLEQQWIDIYGRVALTGEPFRFTEESKQMGRWFDVYAFRPAETNSRKVALLFTDITDKKKAEEALKSSEERQSFLLTLSDQLRSLADPAEIQYTAARLMGEHFHANRVGYAEDGGDGDTIVVTRNYTNGVEGIEGKYKYDDYGPQLLKEFRAGRTVVRNNIAADDTLSDAEKQAHAMVQIGASINVPMLKEGRLFGILFMHCATAHAWSESEIDLIKETADRTWEAVERARVETALRHSEAQFRFMINAVPLSIWITNAEGKTEFLNQHWVDYCGEPYSLTTAADIAARHLHPEDGATVLQAFNEAMRTGTPWEVEQRNLSKDGEYRWFLNRATPYKDPETGRVLKWFGVGIDIHDRKLEEQALQRSEEELEKKVAERTTELAHANEELKRSNQNLEEFAYAASHDLKEPIRKIQFFADRLKDRLSSKLGDEDRRYFERMELGAKRMATLIDDLLLYSHVSNGTTDQELVDLNQIVSFVIDDLELHIEEKGARVSVGTLPAVKGHSRQLQQLFDNLVANALKYSRPGIVPEIVIATSKVTGGETPLHLNAAAENKTFHLIEVRDNGIGFEQADADRIFNVFTRLHGNAEYKGSGVGLSIVRKVAENHNGYIWAESTPGEGTAFKVLLPVD